MKEEEEEEEETGGTPMFPIREEDEAGKMGLGGLESVVLGLGNGEQAYWGVLTDKILPQRARRAWGCVVRVVSVHDSSGRPNYGPSGFVVGEKRGNNGVKEPLTTSKSCSVRRHGFIALRPTAEGKQAKSPKIERFHPCRMASPRRSGLGSHGRFRAPALPSILGPATPPYCGMI